MTRPLPDDAHEAADRIDAAVTALTIATQETQEEAHAALRRLGFHLPTVASSVATYLHNEAVWADECGMSLDDHAAQIVSAVLDQQPDRTPDQEVTA